MTSDEVVATAAALAERILDEVSMPDQNWWNIAALARELAALAESAGARARHAGPEEA